MNLKDNGLFSLIVVHSIVDVINFSYNISAKSVVGSLQY